MLIYLSNRALLFLIGKFKGKKSNPRKKISILYWDVFDKILLAIEVTTWWKQLIRMR
jgi:hypothetical protein